MSEPDFFPDEVPVADAVEQSRPADESADFDTTDPEEFSAVDDGEAPLESNESDWQEQRLAVEDPEDDFR